MSKFLELCEAYGLAKKKTEESRACCLEFKFTNIFIEKMSNYFECPINKEKIDFDEDNTMHVDISLTIYQNPDKPNSANSETIIIPWTLRKVLDNYILIFYPWMKEFKVFWNEGDRFNLIYDFIFEKLKEEYLTEIPLPKEGKESVRNLLVRF